MKLKMLAQSTVLMTLANGKRFLVDPGKYNLDEGRLTPETFPLSDVLVITHKHADHFDLGLVKAILGRGKPTILTNPEIATLLKAEGIASQTFKAGDTFSEGGFALFGTETDHVVRGEAIVNFGLIVCADGVSVYHTSDTRFIDPSLLPKETCADYLLLPVSNRGVVMGIDDAVVFASELKPKLAIPLHCDSPKDKGRVNPAEFVEKVERFGVKARILRFGEEIEL